MRILSLPTEIHLQILQHLSWLDHFTLSTVSPIFTSILQHNSFRRMRYCEEVWSVDEGAHTLNISFRRFLPDEARYWSGGAGWRIEVGLHGLLCSGRLILKLERGGRRTNMVDCSPFPYTDHTEYHFKRINHPMIDALRDNWGEGPMVEISLDLLADDLQYLRGNELDPEASFCRNRPGKDDEFDAGTWGADFSNIGTARFLKGGDHINSVDEALRSGKVSVFDMLGRYPQIIRIRNPIHLSGGDGSISSYSTSGEKYWYVYLPWDGPGSSVKDFIDAVAATLTKEILERNQQLLGCWVKFRQYAFFPLPDTVDRVHPRWKIFLDLIVVEDEACSI